MNYFNQTAPAIRWATILILFLGFCAHIQGAIKRLDGTPIRFDLNASEDVVRISDVGVGVNVDASQALHVTGNAIISGNVLTSQFLIFSELSSSPAAPQSGNGIIYVKNDGKIYFKNDGGVETDLTSGGGGAFSTVSGNASYTSGFVGINDSTPSYSLDVNGTLRVTGVSQFDGSLSTGALTATTINTGQGANELYAMNQNVRTTDAVVFATIDTGQGANELYAMDQNVRTTDVVVFATIDTGQGANELYSMNQNVLTSSSVSFDGVTTSGVVSIDDTTDSTSTTTGSLHTDGGFGVAKRLFVGTGVIINETGANSDTRMEGDGNANLFFIDASADRIAIGSNTPDHFLDLEQVSRSGSHASGRALYVTGGFGAHSSGVEFRHSNGTQGIGIGYDGIYAAGSNSDQNIVLQARGTSAVVINEDSASQDFRVEGNDNANLLFVDASTDRIGIGDSTPSYTLDVNGSVRATGAVHLDNTIAMGIQTITSHATLGSTSLALVDTSSSSITVTLPAASTETGRVYRIKKVSATNTLTLKPTSGSIDDKAEFIYTSGNTAFVNVVSDGSTWLILSQSATGLTAINWTPASLSQLDLWLDASDGSTITKDGSNNISQWNDKSGNSHNAAQATGSKQPLWVSTVQNGRDIIRFDGSSEYFDVSGLGSSIGDISVIVVMKWNTKANLDTVFGTDGSWTTGSFHFIYHSTGDAVSYSQFGQSDKKGDTYAQSTSAYAINSVISSGSGAGSSLKFFYNGKDNDTHSNGTLPNKNLANFNIGSWDNSGTLQRYYDGDIAELIIVEDDLSVSDRQKVEGYLAHKWGLEGELDSGHPYKSEAP